MTPLFWLGLAALIPLWSVVTKLAEIANTLRSINEHARIIRQHDLPEIVRHLEAINRSVNDSH